MSASCTLRKAPCDRSTRAAESRERTFRERLFMAARLRHADGDPTRPSPRRPRFQQLVALFSRGRGGSGPQVPSPGDLFNEMRCRTLKNAPEADLSHYITFLWFEGPMMLAHRGAAPYTAYAAPSLRGMRSVPFATDGDVTRWNGSSPAAALKALVARASPAAWNCKSK